MITTTKPKVLCAKRQKPFVKTTKEIVNDYNHIAPDSLLNGDELWVAVDDLERLLDDLTYSKKPIADLRKELGI